MPLDVIKAEIQDLVKACNEGRQFDENRLDHLVLCLEYNRENILEQENAAKQWRESLVGYSNECVTTMKGFIPPNIFSSSIASLKDQGLSEALAKRLHDKKCLWLIRMRPEDIEKMHIGTLSHRFNPLAQNLDIVEMTAVYSCLPTHFNDLGKQNWMKNIENSLKDMLKKKNDHKLNSRALRNDAYKGQNPIFSHLTELYEMEVVKGVDCGDAVVEEKGIVTEKGRVNEIGRLFIKNPISKK